MDRDRYGEYRVKIMTYSRTWGPVLILLLEMANGPWVVSDIVFHQFFCHSVRSAEC